MKKLLMLHGFGTAGSAVLNFASITYLASILSLTEYGEFSLIQSSSIVIYNVILLWIVQGFIPFAEGKDLAYYKAVIFKLFWILSVAILVIINILGFLIDNIQLFILISIYSISEGLAWLTLEFSKLDVKDKHYIFQNFLRSFLLISFLFAFKLFYKLDSQTSIISFIFANLIPSLLTLHKQDFSNNLKNIGFQDIKKQFDVQKTFMFKHIFTLGLRSIFERSDRYIIDFFLGRSFTGLYSIVVDLARRISSVLGNTIQGYFYSRLGQAFRDNNNGRFKSLLKQNKIMLISLFCFSTISVLLGLIILNKFHLDLKGVKIDLRASVLIMTNVISSFVFAYVMYYYNTIILLNKEIQIWIKTYFYGSLINIILNIIFIKHFGIIAASLAYLLTVIYILYSNRIFIRKNYHSQI